jgi:hypothetical protein
MSRILKAHDLITSPAFIVIKAANEFKDKTMAINQMSRTLAQFKPPWVPKILTTDMWHFGFNLFDFPDCAT